MGGMGHPSQQKELESRIIRLFEKERKGMLLVGGTQIKDQALKFANEMQKDLQLKFSDGWLRHFKSRHGLHYKKAHGEAKSADFAAAEEWLEMN